MRFFSIFFVLMCLSAGVSVTSAQELDLDVVEVELGDDQTARIIPLYQNFDLFVQLVSGELTLRDFPREQRFIAVCGSGWFSAIDSFNLPDFEAGLEQRVLDDYREQAQRIDDAVIDTISDALIASAEWLPSDNINLCLMPVNEMSSVIGGQAADTNMTILIGDYSEPDEEDEAILSLVIAHEYHHHARDADPFTATSGSILLERVITEGMAEMFTFLVYPERAEKYGYPYDDIEASIWQIFEPELRRTDDENFNMFMFGQSDDLPFAAGYYLGLRIMQAYIQNNPDVTVADWTRLSGDTIFEASNYPYEDD